MLLPIEHLIELAKAEQTETPQGDCQRCLLLDRLSNTKSQRVLAQADVPA